MGLRENLGVFFHNAKDVVVKASPDILVVAGVAGLVGTAVLAVKAFKKAEASEEIETLKNDLTELATADSVEEDGKDVAIDAIKRKTGFKLVREYVKIYAPVFLLGLASVGMIFTGHGILKNRLQITSAALAVTEKMFEQYRVNVVEKYGEEEDEALYNGFKTHVMKVTDADGAEHNEEVKTSKMADISPLSVFWGPDYNRFVPKNHVLAVSQLQGVEKDMNYRITPFWGKVYIRDILIALGYEDDYINENPLYAIYGYEHGDTVDFGIYDATVPGNADFCMGRTDTCLLNFKGAHRLINFA